MSRGEARAPPGDDPERDPDRERDHDGGEHRAERVHARLPQPEDAERQRSPRAAEQRQPPAAEDQRRAQPGDRDHARPAEPRSSASKPSTRPPMPARGCREDHEDRVVRFSSIQSRTLVEGLEERRSLVVRAASLAAEDQVAAAATRAADDRPTEAATGRPRLQRPVAGSPIAVSASRAARGPARRPARIGRPSCRSAARRPCPRRRPGSATGRRRRRAAVLDDADRLLRGGRGLEARAGSRPTAGELRAVGGVVGLRAGA